jgi:hypothetical protein
MDSRALNNLLTSSNTFLRLADSGESKTLIVQKSETELLTAGMRLKFEVGEGSGVRVVS